MNNVQLQASKRIDISYYGCYGTHYLSNFPFSFNTHKPFLEVSASTEIAAEIQ